VNVSFLLPFAAGNFIYIGASDLIPEINRHDSLIANLIHFLFFAGGIGLLLVFKFLIGQCRKRRFLFLLGRSREGWKGVIHVKEKPEKWVYAHCGYDASGRFVGDICPQCGLTYWKCKMWISDYSCGSPRYLSGMR